MATKYIIKIPAFNIEIADGTDTPIPPVIDPIPVGPIMTDNRNGNGDVVLPYHYQDTYWDVYYDLDISDRVTKAEFNLKLKVMKAPYIIVNGASVQGIPTARLVLQHGVAGKNLINLSTTTGLQYLQLGTEYLIKIKDIFLARKYQYAIGEWGEGTYIHFGVGDYKYNSGIFYLFPADSGANYIRP